MHREAELEAQHLRSASSSRSCECPQRSIQRPSAMDGVGRDGKRPKVNTSSLHVYSLVIGSASDAVCACSSPMTESFADSSPLCCGRRGHEQRPALLVLLYPGADVLSLRRWDAELFHLDRTKCHQHLPRSELRRELLRGTQLSVFKTMG